MSIGIAVVDQFDLQIHRRAYDEIGCGFVFVILQEFFIKRYRVKVNLFNGDAGLLLLKVSNQGFHDAFIGTG